MAANKTIPTDKSVEKYINTLPNERKKKEAWDIVELLNEITQQTPRMWGPSIIGYDQRPYKHGIMPKLAFSPRKTNHVYYIINNTEEQENLLSKLGKYRTGKVCLYVNKLGDVDLDILEQLLRSSWKYAQRK